MSVPCVDGALVAAPIISVGAGEPFWDQGILRGTEAFRAPDPGYATGSAWAQPGPTGEGVSGVHDGL